MAKVEANDVIQGLLAQLGEQAQEIAMLRVQLSLAARAEEAGGENE